MARTAAVTIRVSRSRALLGGLGILALVYIVLPASWFKVDEPEVPTEAGDSASSLTPPQDIELLRNAAIAKPGDAVGRAKLGLAVARAGNNAEAEPELLAARMLSPNVPVMWFNLGVLYINSDRPGLALEAFRRQLELEPGDARGHYYLGIALEAQGKLAEAETHFSLSSIIEPDYPEPRLWLAILRAWSVPPEQLKAELDPYLMRLPQPDVGEYLLSRAFVRRRSWKTAAYYAERSVHSKPNDFYYWHNLGLIYTALENRQKAREALTKAADLNKRSSIVHIELGLFERCDNRQVEAISQFEKALELDPSGGVGGQVYNFLASIYRNVGDYERAKANEAIFRKLWREVERNHDKQRPAGARARL